MPRKLYPARTVPGPCHVPLFTGLTVFLAAGWLRSRDSQQMPRRSQDAAASFCGCMILVARKLLPSAPELLKRALTFSFSVAEPWEGGRVAVPPPASAPRSGAEPSRQTQPLLASRPVPVGPGSGCRERRARRLRPPPGPAAVCGRLMGDVESGHLPELRAGRCPPLHRMPDLLAFASCQTALPASAWELYRALAGTRPRLSESI